MPEPGVCACVYTAYCHPVAVVAVGGYCCGDVVGVSGFVSTVGADGVVDPFADEFQHVGLIDVTVFVKIISVFGVR